MKRRWVLLFLAGMVACSNGASDGFTEDLSPTVLEETDGTLAGLRLEVPAGAYTGSEPLTMTTGTDITTEGLMDPSLTAQSVGEAVEFGPSGTQFAEPVTISLPFSSQAYNAVDLTEKKIDVLHQTADGAVAGFDVGPISKAGFDVGPISTEQIGFDVGPISITANEGNATHDALLVFQTDHFSTFQVVVLGQPAEPACLPNCAPGPLACGDDGCGDSCGTCGVDMVCENGGCVPKNDLIKQSLCTSEGDTAAVSQEDILEALDQCMAETCQLDGSTVDGKCLVGCLTATTALSDGCASCFYTLADCAVKACENNGTCESNPPSWTCRQQCVGSGECWSDLSECTGLCGDGTCQTSVEDSNNCEEDCPACTPTCENKSCGDDGCGGSCGVCMGDKVCSSQFECVCEPQCDNKECGDDSCGGSCGPCSDGESCNDIDGWCEDDCALNCTNKNCGSDLCGGLCGTCAMGESCSAAGTCVCEGSCGGKVCGLDGCGVSCGTCNSDTEYCSDGLCELKCLPNCLVTGNECGDDGCGGSCGTCTGGNLCAPDGVCVPQDCITSGLGGSETQQTCFGNTWVQCEVDTTVGGQTTYTTAYCPNTAMTCKVTQQKTPMKAQCKCDDGLCAALAADPCISASQCVKYGGESICEIYSYEGCISVGGGGFLVQDPMPGGTTKDMDTSPDASMDFDAITVVEDLSVVDSPVHIITLHLLAPWNANPTPPSGNRVYEVLLQKLSQLSGVGASTEEQPLTGSTNRTQWSNLTDPWKSYALIWNGSGWDDETTPKVASCKPDNNDATRIVCTIPHSTSQCLDLFDPSETGFKVYTRYTTATGEVATKAWTSSGTSISGGFIPLQ